MEVVISGISFSINHDRNCLYTRVSPLFMDMMVRCGRCSSRRPHLIFPVATPNGMVFVKGFVSLYLDVDILLGTSDLVRWIERMTSVTGEDEANDEITDEETLLYNLI